jgi:hypothetical protein
MIMIKLILMAAAVLAIVVGTTISIQQVQAKYIINKHSHSDASDADKASNDGTVVNCSGGCLDENGNTVEKYHSNTNDNTNREGASPEERSNTNNHEIPNGNGNGNSDGE